MQIVSEIPMDASLVYSSPSEISKVAILVTLP